MQGRRTRSKKRRQKRCRDPQDDEGGVCKILHANLGAQNPEPPIATQNRPGAILPSQHSNVPRTKLSFYAETSALLSAVPVFDAT
eukprot:2733526-Rhodomonas_salina.1